MFRLTRQVLESQQQELLLNILNISHAKYSEGTQLFHTGFPKRRGDVFPKLFTILSSRLQSSVTLLREDLCDDSLADVYGTFGQH